MKGLLTWLNEKIDACEQRAEQVDEDLKFVYLDAAQESRQARTAVAALIERNAELEAALSERNADYKTVLEHGVALAAENKALREAMLTVRMSIKFKSLSAEQQGAINAALARTPAAKENDSCDSAT